MGKQSKGENLPANGQTASRGDADGKKAVDNPKAADVDALRKKLAAARADIGLRKRPVTAIRLSLASLAESAAQLAKWVLRNRLTWLVVVPLIAAWSAAKFHFAPELFVPPVCGERDPGILWWLELAVKEVSWWVILGILSSVGFGTGLHSGIMFLFPHVMQVVGAAEACNTSTGLVTWYQHPCKLDCATTTGPKDGSTVTLLGLWTLVTVPCMLWGVGTAIGELPPYLITRAARLSGSKDSEYEAELEDAKGSNSAFNKLKMWTIAFTQKHGFLGVFLLASWPNAAFDMCGMCCGYVLMPFWTFFIATCMGKGIVKVNLQAFFFVMLFGSVAFKVLLSSLDACNGAVQGVIGIDLRLREVMEKGRASLVLQFEQQSRFAPEKLFAGKGGYLDRAALQEIYAKHQNSTVIAKRVLQEWDADGDSRLSLAELSAAASRTDDKVSLGSLDPGAGSSYAKMAFDLFLVGLVLFFVVSVIEQAARKKQEELDEAEIDRVSKEQQKKK